MTARPILNWVSLPKIELHLHLDISLSFETAIQLNPSLTRETYARDFVAPAKCSNLSDFLKRVPPILELLQTEHALQLLAQDIFRQLARDNVVYAELRFAPLLHTQRGLSPQAVVQIVEAAIDRASHDTGIDARLILCSLRHFGTEQSMQTVQLVDQFRGSRVVAFDLAGDEAGFPLTAHLEAFRFAADHHIPITSHAGEASGAQSVWETLQMIKPPRIGHGVRSIEDPFLVKYLKQKDIHLEICPTCNIQLDVFSTHAEHSVDALYHQNISLSISTDNRTLTPITLTQEYEKLAMTFGWSKDDFLKCNIHAIQAAFVPDSVRNDLLRRVTQAYESIND
jgi:adenosine deaminase